MTEEQEKPIPPPIGEVLDGADRQAAIAKIAEVATGGEAELPAILYLETHREGGETTTLRDTYYELLEKEKEGRRNPLTLDEYCQLTILRTLFTRGSVSTSLVGLHVPKSYLPKRPLGITGGDYANLLSAYQAKIDAAYTAAFYYIKNPGITDEARAAVEAEVEKRREVLERELREQAAEASKQPGAQAGDGSEGTAPE